MRPGVKTSLSGTVILGLSSLAFIAAGVVGARASEVRAAPAPLPVLAQLLAGEKIYTTDFGGFYPRDDIWIFAPDGTLTGNYTVYKTGLTQHYIHDEGTETGRWRVADGKLCLAWERPETEGEDCYSIEKISAPPEGPDIWGAMHTAGGKSWRFVFARYVTLDWPWGAGANWGLPFHRLTDREQ